MCRQRGTTSQKVNLASLPRFETVLQCSRTTSVVNATGCLSLVGFRSIRLTKKLPYSLARSCYHRIQATFKMRTRLLGQGKLVPVTNHQFISQKRSSRLQVDHRQHLIAQEESQSFPYSAASQVSRS